MSPLDSLLAEMEDEVRAAVADGTKDLVLAKLIEITTRAIYAKKELFPNTLHEPAFYGRHFRPWVQSALDEKEALDKFHQGALKKRGIQ